MTELLDNETPECLDSDKGNCEGAVEYRSSLTGTGTPIPRCDKHWSDRLEFQAQTERDYPVNPPDWFDPMNAGEHWGRDY